MKYKFLSHTADIKFRGFGNSIEEVFENSALAITNIISKDKIQDKKRKKLIIQGHDKENLLYEFLEEFLFLFETEFFLLNKIKSMRIEKDEDSDEYRLECELIGETNKNYEITNHIKAITYNEMFVKEHKGKWISQVVVDV